MSVKTKGLLGDINKANVLHNPVQVKNLNFNSYTYILYYQSNMPSNLRDKYTYYPRL